VRSELHENFRRNRLDDPLAGAASLSEKSWRGAQLGVRTSRYAYTAFLQLDPENQTAARWEASSFRLVDETLYDLEARPDEADNIAYDGDQKDTRTRLLELCLREWGVRLRGPRATSRRVRAAYMRALSG